MRPLYHRKPKKKPSMVEDSESDGPTQIGLEPLPGIQAGSIAFREILIHEKPKGVIDSVISMDVVAKPRLA